jgi:kinesin family protein C1
MVEEALNGHNCCIMAFGQKGSGKTYTMEGPLGTLDNPASYGIILQSACYIFEVIETLKTEWAHQITISHLEIHNEILCDLLSTQPEDDKILEIKQDEKLRKTWVANLTTVKVHNTESVASLLRNEKCLNRTDTSRSHFVFQFHIVGKSLKTQETHEGYLNLISLASSDRDSGTMTNDTKKDAIHINSDLFCLNNVLVALVNHEKNVPYRSSKLTHLLQYSLGGNGKASLLATLSPSEQDFKETINTLRFAAKVNTYEIGTSKKPKPKN